MELMKLIFTDGHWQEVSIGCELNDKKELSIIFDSNIDDKVQFELTVEQVEQLCSGLLEHIKQFK